jgi:carboxyl-terminal processing protease
VGQEKPFQVKLERQEITIFTIKGFERKADGQWDYMIEPESKVGYVRMTNFTEGTIDELKDILETLREEEKMRGLIFDLRGNPGGPLKSAVDVTDLFLDGNKKIVSTKDRGGQMWSKSSTDDVKFGDFPLIILVDETTASASEIVSGALQIHKRALILGERSYGKGSVQQVLPLNRSNMAFLKLTTAHYYLPNGRCLHREEDATTWGVDPDVHVRLVPKEFVKMNELRLKKDILKGRNQSSLSEEELKAVTEYSTSKESEEAEDKDTEKKKETTKPAEADADEVDESKLDPPRKDDNEFPAIDPQLEVALSLMRIRLESGLDWLQSGPEQIAQTSGDPIAGTPAAAAK